MKSLPRSSSASRLSSWGRWFALASLWLLAAACVDGAVVAASGSGVKPTTVTFTRVDGTQGTGVWLGCGATGTVRLRVDGAERDISLDELSRIELGRSDSAGNHPADAKPWAAGHVLFPAAGGRLSADILSSDSAGLTVRGDLFASAVIPFGQLAAVRWHAPDGFPKASASFVQAMRRRLPGKDVLVTIGDDVKTLRGRLIALDASGGRFSFGGSDRRFKSDKVFGVVFALGAGAIAREPARLVLTDGSEIPGRIVGGDPSSIRFQTAMGFTLDAPIARVARVEIESERVVYVSDLNPQSQQTDGIIHEPWPVRMDRNASAGLISLGGRRFAKGIGCHSRTSLVYALDGDYQTFAATIGIDDHVRPRGNVVFRVRGDDRVLFDSGNVSGRDDPRDVVIDVAGVQRIELEVDYGEGLDLADHADWAAARLIKRDR